MSRKLSCFKLVRNSSDLNERVENRQFVNFSVDQNLTFDNGLISRLKIFGQIGLMSKGHHTTFVTDRPDS